MVVIHILADLHITPVFADIETEEAKTIRIACLDHHGLDVYTAKAVCFPLLRVK